MKYQTQKVALAYFVCALILFAAQVTFGLVLGYIYVAPNFLSELLPFNIARMVHTNALIVWLLLGFFGAAYYLVPEESERELHSPKLAYLQLAILMLGASGAVLTYLFNPFEGNILLGKEGRELSSSTTSR
jgi:nitric oxide reductase subunit B